MYILRYTLIIMVYDHNNIHKLCLCMHTTKQCAIYIAQEFTLVHNKLCLLYTQALLVYAQVRITYANTQHNNLLLCIYNSRRLVFCIKKEKQAKERKCFFLLETQQCNSIGKMPRLCLAKDQRSYPIKPLGMQLTAAINKEATKPKGLLDQWLAQG